MESPDNIRIKNRKKRLKSIWSSSAWKKAVKEFTAGRVCQWCGGTKYLTAHHPYRNSLNDETYLNLYLSGCLCLCRSCHFAIHHSLILCPICKLKYMRIGADCCYGCYLLKHPEIVEMRLIAEERRKRDRKEYALKRRLAAKKAHDLSRNNRKDN